MSVRLAINGFGRTGRSLLRSIIASHDDLEVVAVNDLGSAEALSRLFSRDSVHGVSPVPVSVVGETMVVGPRRIEMLSEPDVSRLPWKDLEVDVVVESTGRFTKGRQAAGHLEAGAGRVVISAPAENPDATFVIGVNDELFDPARHFIISNASCTTNCLAVLAKVLDDAFGVSEGFMTTVHAYTGDQRLVDSLHKDPRRGRAAGLNIVPTTTGAARATGVVLPSVAGHLDGLALRVPVPDGSVTDLVAILNTSADKADVNEAYRQAATAGSLKGVLEYSNEPLVSTDIVGSQASCVFDSELTMTSGRLVKVLGWYDNETGYSSRLADLARFVGSHPVR